MPLQKKHKKNLQIKAVKITWIYFNILNYFYLIQLSRYKLYPTFMTQPKENTIYIHIGSEI